MMNKRQRLWSGWLVAPAVILTSLSLPSTGAQDPAHPAKKLKVVVFGGHPDDPESGAGGLIATLTAMGHEVILAYGTAFRGERKFFGRPEDEVRRAEATTACSVLGATPKFFPYAHEKLVADLATAQAVAAWFSEVKPDVVVTHWPLDTHPNHHAVSSLVWQCYQRTAGWNLYFFEVMTDQQTIAFRPDLYLDIKMVRDVKRLRTRTAQESRPSGNLDGPRADAPPPWSRVRHGIRRGIFTGGSQDRLCIAARPVSSDKVAVWSARVRGDVPRAPGHISPSFHVLEMGGNLCERRAWEC